MSGVVGVGNGEEERGSDNSTGQERLGRRRGYRGFSSSLCLGWGVAPRNAAVAAREEALLAQSHVAGDRFISCHDQRLCRRQSLLVGAS